LKAPSERGVVVVAAKDSFGCPRTMVEMARMPLAGSRDSDFDDVVVDVPST